MSYPSHADLLASDAATLARQARTIRDQRWGRLATYSRKVFIPLTQLCRDVCHYCTFAQRPRQLKAPYLAIDEVLAIARAGAAQGCKEALFTLGDQPERRYEDARRALDHMGHATTIDYVAQAARRVHAETGLLPHVNAGCLTPEQVLLLRPVAASVGLMLESTSRRLLDRGMPHHGSPDKDPSARIATLEACGEARVPVTTGLLIGIGETREERLDTLLAIDALHVRYGHVQEVIIQNFRAKPGTRMAGAPDAPLEELLWTIAAARLLLAPDISLQAPPNLNPGAAGALLDAGINDFGGISPVTPDHVNPEAPWPAIAQLAADVDAAGHHLHERLTVYPSFVRAKETWIDATLHPAVDRLADAEGHARDDEWFTGRSPRPPAWAAPALQRPARPGDGPLARLLERLEADDDASEDLAADDIEWLFTARGDDFTRVCRHADALRRRACGDDVTYVVNRNINYTNICGYKCRFCGFSKGRSSEQLRGKPYRLDLAEIQRRVREAEDRGATEVCLQGGIHPDYTGNTYLEICRAVREAAPGIHIHAFSPLEVFHGASTLGLPLHAFLERLQHAGLNTLPGTAAEILHDEVRSVLCADKVNTAQWLAVMRAAHEVGLRSTATIMFGHIDRHRHWAAHLLAVRDLQRATGGFTEFVPLPYVAHEAPMFLKGRSRAGPTFRESILMHAVARIVLHGAIRNIQASWVKLGVEGVGLALRAGANDFGGTLMDESITRASGGGHGQELDPARIAACARSLDRTAVQRSTLYGRVAERTAGATERLRRIAVVAA